MASGWSSCGRQAGVCASGAEEAGAGEDVDGGVGGLGRVGRGAEESEGDRVVAECLQGADEGCGECGEWERAAEAVVKQLQHFDDGALVLQNSDAGQLHAGDGGKGASGGGDVVVRE